jgi:predicted NUDIX family NTP pyrophosphohydrolase
MKEGLVDNNSNAGRVDVNLLKDFGGKYAKLLNDRYSITKGEIGTDESKKRTNTLRIYYQKLAGKIYIHGHPRNL